MKIPRIPSSVRRRRTLNCPRRYRCRSSTPFRTILQSNATRRQRQKSSMIVQQQQHSAHKSVVNQLYQTIYPLDDSPDHVEQIKVDEEGRRGDQSHHRKSSSSTLVSLTNTIISSETLSSEDDPQPPLSRIGLGLNQKDVQFIHEILQRTQGDPRASNRIAALKQAYIRAANNRQEFLKSNPIVPLNVNEKKKASMKQSVIASKIRDELEKYDELPAYSETCSDDETYSINDEEEDYRQHHHHHRYYHRRLPEIPSTTHRIIDFLSTLKRQLQHNFQKIRSRILIEMMANPSSSHPRKRSYHVSQPPVA